MQLFVVYLDVYVRKLLSYYLVYKNNHQAVIVNTLSQRIKNES